jgi:hydrogenase maturation protein HypF
MELGLAGVVGNDTHGAFVEVEGAEGKVGLFGERLGKELPPLAQITELKAQDIGIRGDKEFSIKASLLGSTQDAEITPDAATCWDCLRELFDPDDRRYGYPFINCTNCGPRYSIIQSVPYDRPNTTMKKFEMCGACQAEYDDPGNRRFHAQPNACPVCGPKIWMADSRGNEIAGEAIGSCVQMLVAGKIVAVKGIGGFHLACRADDDEAVLRLRERKGREAKPFALMVAWLAEAKRLAEVNSSAGEIMTSVHRPIVLVPKVDMESVSEYVAPGSDCYGIMLPYTPLHELLFAEGLGPLVMTSGNPSDEPLSCDNDEALQRLGDIADAFLLHDRDIERKIDDPVVMAFGRPVGRVMQIRRARGFVPEPIHVETVADEPILAVGGELKSTVCVLAGGDAVLSEHLGELPNAEAYRNFIRTIEQFKELLGVEPKIVACDLHPYYAATRYARWLGLRTVEVQHHHAHVVSCMADNEISGRVIGISCDGTGYGSDGTIWGCEVLACDEADFERVGHLGYFPLFGGDVAAYETWRPAVGLLCDTFGEAWPETVPSAAMRIDNEALSVFQQRIGQMQRMPQTSSLGRLFDGIGFLLGLCERNRYEAEAAMSLEATARRHPKVSPLCYTITSGQDAEFPMEIGVRPMIRLLVEGIEGGGSIEELARAFHETVAAMLSDCADRAAGLLDLNRVVLSGGCMANRLLVEGIIDRLDAVGREVYVHKRVPMGDGGLSLGQAVVAAERFRRDTKCV